MDEHTFIRRQDGFTLIELLVVILIIGILAAIALPAFLKQRSKGQDATAKSDVRALAAEIEACFPDDETFIGCAAKITTNGTSLPIGSGPGQVEIVLEDVHGYELRATSRSDLGGQQHTFTLRHNIGGQFGRPCAPAGEGGCRPDGTW